MRRDARLATSPARISKLAVILIFLAALTAPGLGLVAGVDRATISEAEMRELAPAPAWSWQLGALAAWPAAFRRYFVDHFAFRSRLIHMQAVLSWEWLRTSPSDTVIAGTDGWLFYGDDGGLQDYVQTEPFDEASMEAWRETLERTRDWLDARGIKYLVVFAPDKQMIYPEYMPASLGRLSPKYRVDRLIEYLRRHSTLDPLDLRPAVRSAKSSELLYDRYDTHWNDRGGLVGYQAIMERLQRWFPSMRPLTRDDFVESAAAPSGDRTTMLGLVDQGKIAMPGLVRRGGWSARVVEPATPDPYGEEGRLVSEIPGSSLPRAVVFRDSFAGRLMPYLSEHFSRAVYLWENDFDPTVVEREHPDVVVQEFVARHLYTFLPYPDLVPPVTPRAASGHSRRDGTLAEEVH
jgi:alginate O-acetyltransferase complex protein AlgJ